MKWYLAKIVFRIISGKGDHKAQFDEQLRLIEAIDRAAAFEKAKIIGKNTEECYLNQQKETVRWKFINVEELYHLHELQDGTEIYSRIQEYEEAENHIHVINTKALHIGGMQYIK
jgi:hypothetical protein